LRIITAISRRATIVAALVLAAYLGAVAAYLGGLDELWSRVRSPDGTLTYFALVMSGCLLAAIVIHGLAHVAVAPLGWHDHASSWKRSMFAIFAAAITVVFVTSPWWLEMLSG
jgi:hypothetical protein